MEKSLGEKNPVGDTDLTIAHFTSYFHSSASHTVKENNRWYGKGGANYIKRKKNKQGIERTKQNRKPMTRQDAITEEVLKSGPFWHMTHLILHPRTAGQFTAISYGQNDSRLQEKRVSTLQNTRQQKL